MGVKDVMLFWMGSTAALALASTGWLLPWSSASVQCPLDALSVSPSCSCSSSARSIIILVVVAVCVILIRTKTTNHDMKRKGHGPRNLTPSSSHQRRTIPPVAGRTVLSGVSTPFPPIWVALFSGFSVTQSNPDVPNIRAHEQTESEFSSFSGILGFPSI